MCLTKFSDTTIAVLPVSRSRVIGSPFAKARNLHRRLSGTDVGTAISLLPLGLATAISLLPSSLDTMIPLLPSSLLGFLADASFGDAPGTSGIPGVVPPDV